MDRGVVVRAGIEGSMEIAMRNRKAQFVAGLILLVVPFSLPLILTITVRGGVPGVPHSAWVLASAMLPILGLILLNLVGGLEIDAIYENGVTNKRSTVLDRILGKGYVRFEDIEIIGQGKELEDDDEVPFVALMSINKRLLIKPFADFGYEDDFFDFLIETLKAKCKDAEWIEVELKGLRLI